MAWSEKEIEALATSHFRGGAPRCPACKARVDVQEIRTLGRRIATLMLHCQRCGERASFSEDHLEAMSLEWTQDQLKEIEDQYFAQDYATCPNDGSTLKLSKMHTLGSRTPYVHGSCPRCGRRFASTMINHTKPASPFEVKYEMLREIGRGGMGAVSLVRERTSGAEYAAKMILPEYVRDAGIVRRFQREERLLRSVIHPNVVPLVDAFLDESGGVLVMEVMPHGDLGSWIKKTSATTQQLVELFENVVEGVSALHGKGIIHRDLKPSNVLIDKLGHARVSDFGLAVLQIRDTTPLTKAAAGLGTRHYAAPEQMSSAATVTAKADVYALGLIAYEIATRESPFSHPIMATGNSALDAAIKAALSRDPAARPDSGTHLADALRGTI